MAYKCDFPITLRGVLASLGDFPEKSELFTGAAFYLEATLVCPYTTQTLPEGSLVFWDEAYTDGIWRVISS